MLSAPFPSEINHTTESMQQKLISEAKNRRLCIPNFSLRYSKAP